MKCSKLLCAGMLVAACGWANAEEQWNFQLSPYIWFAGSKGDVATLPGLPAAEFEMTPKEAFDDNEASYMVVFEAKKGKQGFLVDVLYADTQSNYELIPKIGLEMEITSKNTIVSAAYVYEFFQDDTATADFFGGIRYWDVESILQFKGGLGILAGRKLDSKEDWVDPVIGAKGRTKLGDTNFFAMGWMAFGGFGVGSDHFYDMSANVGYQWTQAINTTFGYRAYDVDYEDGDYLYDVKNEGWIIGLTWAF